MAYTIKDLQEGKVAVVNDGTLEELKAVLKAAFQCSPTPEGDAVYYFQHPDDSFRWSADRRRFLQIKLPTQSVKVFMEELQPTPEQPKPHPVEATQSLLDQVLQHLSIKYNKTSSGTQFFVSPSETTPLFAPASSASSRYPQLPLKDSLGESIVKTTAPTLTTEGQPHYDNSKGSLYQFAEDQELNSWEFDICKRVIRCRKKGCFKEDLEKTKFLIDLYLKEQGHLYENDKN